VNTTEPTEPTEPTVLDPFLAELCARGGSDLLLTAGSPPLIRIDGTMHVLLPRALEPAETEAMVLAALDSAHAATFRERLEVDFSFGRRGLARFRANAFRQRGAAALSIRMIPYRIPSFDELELPPIVDDFISLPEGLVLVTGPTGSGKSTTLASVVDAINARRACHVLTIEDPIEYLHTHQRAAVNQREIGVDTLSFSQALRSVLREDPDVVLIGELRDADTISAALTVAETGHMVLSSLHTNDAAQTVDRIVDVFPAEQQAQVRTQLALSLQAVISQRLVPRRDGGRIAAFEVLVANSAVRNLVREGRTSQLRNQIMTGTRDGMQTLEASLSALVQAGLVTLEAASALTLNPHEITESAA
jgi:twitching motility protein PilT